MNYQDKLDLFIEALKESKEENKNKEYFQETIDLYSKKKGFSFLISLFAKIYQKKNLCQLLIQKFYDMNVNLKVNEKSDGNSDRDEKLGQFNSLMAKISSESEALITANDYNKIQFYGVIICYFNYYDYKTFENCNCINNLYKDDKKTEILYEILLVYFTHFLNPVKKEEEDKSFFVNFFEHIITKKGFSFLNQGLTIISYIDTFITVIDKTKEKIYEYVQEKNNKANFKPIKLKDNLKLKKEKIKDIMKGISFINIYQKIK